MASYAVPVLQPIVRLMAEYLMKKVPEVDSTGEYQRTAWIMAVATVIKQKHATRGRPRAANRTVRDALIVILVERGWSAQDAAAGVPKLIELPT